MNLDIKLFASLKFPVKLNAVIIRNLSFCHNKENLTLKIAIVLLPISQPCDQDKISRCGGEQYRNVSSSYGSHPFFFSFFSAPLA